MIYKVSPEAYAQSLEIAEKLKAQFEKELLGKGITPPVDCSCGTGEAVIVAVTYPTIQHQNEIGLFDSWQCTVRHAECKERNVYLSSCISHLQLYPRFRDAFAGIDVPVDHPRARPFMDMGPYSGPRVGANFHPSGRTVFVTADNPVCVRPLGTSAWLNAQLCIEEYVGERIGRTFLSCHVDPFEVGQKELLPGMSKYQLSDMAKPSELHTFYIDCPGRTEGRHQIAIARVVDANLWNRQVVFELDASVESFVPEPAMSAITPKVVPTHTCTNPRLHKLQEAFIQAEASADNFQLDQIAYLVGAFPVADGLRDLAAGCPRLQALLPEMLPRKFTPEAMLLVAHYMDREDIVGLVANRIRRDVHA